MIGNIFCALGIFGNLLREGLTFSRIQTKCQSGSVDKNHCDEVGSRNEFLTKDFGELIPPN